MYLRGDTVFVYKYTNEINGKVYVGITTRTVEIRHKEHLKKINDNYVFHRALKKYGANNFKLEVLRECKDLDELKVVEMFYIKELSSFINAENSNGYNMTFGGEGTVGFKHSVKTRLNFSIAKKELYKNSIHPAIGVHHTEERKLKQRIRMIGKYCGDRNHYYGKKHSEETKAIMSKKAKKRFSNGKHPMLGIKLSEEQKKNIGLFHKGKTISQEQRKKQSDRVKGANHPIATKIKCLTTGETFDYMGEASIKYNIDRSNLTKCCKGKTNWCGIHPVTKEKLTWSYYETDIL